MKKLKGIRLDIGCGENKISPAYTGMDRRPLEGVEIVHDLEVFPWPLDDGACLDVVASHVIEHIKPWIFIDFMNEVWRVLKTGGKFALAAPYGVGFLYVQDPTHCNPSNEATWQYFDPKFPLYDIYKPKPWSIDYGFPVWQVSGNIEVLMTKIEEGQKIEHCPHGRKMGREHLIFQGGAVSTCKCCMNEFPHFLPYHPDFCPVCEGMAGMYGGVNSKDARGRDLITYTPKREGK